ncbi:MAG: NAD-glutamate dehydrogenase, partial [Alphaproteobacteria bacterium]|nr:NAD-glutamate dehydrogenase [Alphaproteobacteria bacterium]
IYKIEDVLRTGKLQLDLYKPDSCGPRQLRLKIYSPDTPINLSDVLPILENMGLRVVSELPFEVSPQGLEQPRTVWIHDFLAQAPETDQPLDLALVKENFEQSFTDIWYGHIDADGLNKLVVNAGLTGRQVTILRTYVRYMRQIGYPYSRPYIQTALTTNPKIAYALAMMFKAQFDPKAQKNADARVSEYAKVIEQALEKVESLDQDRILRSLKALMDATLRTNYFLRDEQGQPKPFISIKLDSRQLLDLPEPRPYREIFVYSPRVEAVHLRGDKIARGGIRWSDRHEDFRTEVLGLMKAQMVKNALIVPMGAKGGFVVKAKFKDRAKFQAEGIECYRTMVRGMLDITDNLKGSKVIPPKDVVRRDGDDPYLVVAADKGTATFSDIANAISKEYDFWLGDAFASGGSAGYDHKKMGITARGAWESVKMHFRALNHDTQKRPFDVVGVGDMGGDVFGNGMLQSDQIRLVGAFNHVHIFCDPNPDPKSSFAERKRLFEKVQGWDHYDLKKLSAGGQIYSRSEKLLTLTPEIQARFDITKSKVTPLELMQAILKARTDLIFFGGIGTYIKSSFETHNDVGDKANDAIRIDGRDVRAKVIGEGANLGVTQRGRVEFSDQGGRINTDFLDNSGGVDTSDHEVNIKILFSDIMRSGKNTLDIKARNQMLSQMREEVGSHIIRDNYQQSQAISLAEFSGRETLALQEEFIADLERDYGLNRVLEGLPDTETVQQRLRNGKGLTRPELCVLHAHAKILFTQELLASDVPDSPEMQSWLRDYFPLPLQKKFPDAIAQHRLRREIIATSIANSMVNRMGATFIKATSKKTGASVAAITRAYVIVRDVFNLRKLWDDIEALDNKVPAEVQLKAMRAIAQLAEREILWFLTRLGHTPDLTQDTKDYSQGLEVLLKNLDKLVGEEQRMTIAQRQSAAVENGLPLALARHLALVPVLSSACDIIRIALESKTDLALTAKIYFSLGQRFHLDWLRQQARFITSEDPWHRDAAAALIDQFYSSQAGLTIRVMKELSAFKKAQDPLAQWINKNPDLFAQVTPLIERLRGIGTVDLAMLVIAEQRLRGLAGL